MELHRLELHGASFSGLGWLLGVDAAVLHD